MLCEVFALASHRVRDANTSCLCVCVNICMYVCMYACMHVHIHTHREKECVCVCVCACDLSSGMRCSYVLLVFVCVCVYIYEVCVCVPAPHHRVHGAHASCLCRDWSSHASRTMSSIKTKVNGAALEYVLEDHKGVESCRRQQIPSSSLRSTPTPCTRPA